MKDKILILPDSFKGSLSAVNAGQAMEAGVQRALAEAGKSDSVQVYPVADGGEGTVEALCAALQGQTDTLSTVDPFGSPVEGVYAVLSPDTAVFDMATCCGLELAKRHGLNPLRASTYGVGKMITGLIERGYRRILVGLGGSGTNDGGIGALAALGAVFTDVAGNVVDGSAGGQVLSAIADMDLSGVRAKLSNVELILLYDVAVPLTGETGATLLFGRQKGATETELARLETGMCHYADCICKRYGNIPDAAGSGAAGGLGCGLHLAGGKLCHGASYILDTLGIPALLAETALVFTGEGKTDVQTAKGKLPCTVARYAKAAGVPCIDICGQAEPVAELYDSGMTKIVPLVQNGVTAEMAMAHTAELLEETAYMQMMQWLQ